MVVRCVTGRFNNAGDSKKALASHAGVFRGVRISSLPTRDEIPAPLKTPAWEDKKVNTPSLSFLPRNVRQDLYFKVILPSVIYGLIL